jgi:hypothetical protein
MIEILKEPLFISLLLSFGAFIFILTLLNIRVCIFLLIFAVALSPKINIGGIPLRVEDFFMMLLIFSWFARLAIKRENFPSTSLNWSIIVYLLACFFSTAYGYYNGTVNLFSSDYSMSAFFHFFKKIQVFVMAYILVSDINTKKDVIRTLKYILVSAFMLALYGVKQGLTEYRISGPVGEGSNTFGMYFVFLTIICIGLFFYKKPPYNKFFLLLSILLFLFVIMGSLSRVSYVSLGLLILFLGLFKEKKLLLAFLLILIVLFSFFPSKIIERVLTVKTLVEPSTTERYSSWDLRKLAWRDLPPIVFEKSPLFGFGLASASLSYAESQYITDLYFTGIFGVLAFIWLCIRIIKLALFVKKSDDPFIKNFAAYFLAAFTAFLFAGISGPVFTAIRTANLLWLFIGLLAGIQNLMLENKLGNEEPKEDTPVSIRHT